MTAQPATVLLIEDDRIKRGRIRDAILAYPAWRERYRLAFIEARDYPGAYDEIEKLTEPPLFTVMDSKLPGVPASLGSEQAGAALCLKLRAKRSLLQAARKGPGAPEFLERGFVDGQNHHRLRGTQRRRERRQKVEGFVLKRMPGPRERGRPHERQRHERAGQRSPQGARSRSGSAHR